MVKFNNNEKVFQKHRQTRFENEYEKTVSTRFRCQAAHKIQFQRHSLSLKEERFFI